MIDTAELLQRVKKENFKSHKQCTKCVFYVSNYVDDYTLRHFGYGDVKIRPACSWCNTFGFVSHNPAAMCTNYQEKKRLSTYP